MKTWTIDNLIEYRDVMVEKLSDFAHEDSMPREMYVDYLRTKNNLQVVMDEIKNRK